MRPRSPPSGARLRPPAIHGPDPSRNRASMIPRYSRPEMADIWSPETKYRIWFEIEAHALDAMAELGQVPQHVAGKVWEKGREAAFDATRIEAIEREVK